MTEEKLVFSTEMQKAFDFAYHAHLGQTRKGNGLPYFTHVVEVVCLLSEWGVADLVTLKAACCHDVREERPDLTPASVSAQIDTEAAAVVEELTFFVDPASPVKASAQKAAYMDGFADKSVKALVIKIADRVCNVRNFYASQRDYAAKYWNKATSLRSAVFARSDQIEAEYGLGVLLKIKATHDALEAMLKT
jgi:(p)ppGpp synthase/HD superfamily hydrolase